MVALVVGFLPFVYSLLLVLLVKATAATAAAAAAAACQNPRLLPGMHFLCSLRCLCPSCAGHPGACVPATAPCSDMPTKDLIFYSWVSYMGVGSLYYRY